MASKWLAEHVAALGDWSRQTIPAIDPAIARAVIPGLDLWDMWPVQRVDGSTARFDGWTVWLVLSAPGMPDPDERHHVARIRLLTERDGAWRDCGNLLPDGLSPGSREWAGSALFDPALGRLTLFYTVAGYRGEASATFAQRLFQVSADFACTAGEARADNWGAVAESVAADGCQYMIVNQAEGVPGFIKGFRDPAHFRDPATGADYLLFTGSLPQSRSAWNGCIGIARASGAGHTGWSLLPPLVTADGLNNEQERPHVIHHGGLYYLFWSTQRKVFEPHGPSGPNGLYGMVAPALLGPYAPLNGTGLVAANPGSAPFQAYSWWVTADLDVHGFVDLLDVPDDGPVDSAAWRRAHFGGCPAPVFRLALDGARAWVQG